MRALTGIRRWQHIALAAVLGIVPLLLSGCCSTTTTPTTVTTRIKFVNQTSAAVDVTAHEGIFAEQITHRAIQPGSDITDSYTNTTGPLAPMGDLTGTALVARQTVPLPKVALTNGSVYEIIITKTATDIVVTAKRNNATVGTTTTALGTVTTTVNFVNNSTDFVDIVSTMGTFGAADSAMPLADGSTLPFTFTNTNASGAAMGNSSGTISTFGGGSATVPTVALVNGSTVTFTITGDAFATPSTLAVSASVTPPTSASNPRRRR